MRLIKVAPFILLLGFSSVLSANDFPTRDRVEYVLNCFQELGRRSMDDLQTCSCRIDSIASNLSFETYDYAVTYERNKRMGDEKGGGFSHNDAGKAVAKQLTTAKETTIGQCQQVVQIVAPTDLTGDERYSKINEVEEDYGNHRY